MPDKIKEKLCLSFLILGAKILVTTFSAAGRTDCIAGIAMHTYFHVEQPGFSFGKFCHRNTLLSALITKL